jgi:hypothetical protein
MTREELDRTLSALDDALSVAIEEVAAIIADEEAYLLCKTGRVNAMESHLANARSKVAKMREACGLLQKK